MGKRIIFLICILGILVFCSLTLVCCDAQDLMSELLQVSDESEETAGTEEQTSVLAEIQTEIETKTKAETEAEPETETTAVDLAWGKYELVSYDGFKVHAEHHGTGGTGGSVQIIENHDQLQEFYDEFRSSQIYLGYEPEYFECKSLVIIIFEYSSGEVFQSLDGIVIKDGTLCPVITIDSQTFLSDDMLYCIMTVEIGKEDAALSAGELLIINLHDPSKASRYHKTRFE